MFKVKQSDSLTLEYETDRLFGNVGKYEGWNFNSGNYLFTTDTK